VRLTRLPQDGVTDVQDQQVQWEKRAMITAIVQFKVAEDVGRDEVLTNMRNVAPRFETVAGLIRKNFLFDEARGIGGGVYTWETLEAAEELYAEGGAWRQAIRDLYGVEAEVTIFETPIIVDNAIGEIKTAA